MVLSASLVVCLEVERNVLVNRVDRKLNQTPLTIGDSRKILAQLMALRCPVYAQADVALPTRSKNQKVTAAEMIKSLD